MRQSRWNGGRIAAVTLAAAALIAVTAVVSSELAGASDVARRAPRSTHIGALPSDFVVLTMVDPTGSPKFVRVNPDGSTDSTEYAVPDGRILVVTDADSAAYTNSNFGSAAALRLFIEDVSSGDRSLVFMDGDGLRDINPQLNGFKNIGTSRGLNTGFVVGAGVRLVADTQSPSNVGSDALRAWPNANARVLVRGYLTDAN